MANQKNSRDRARTVADAKTIRKLSSEPAILQVINVWDAVTARVISDLPYTKVIATAGHSIAAMHGYPDGENIPVDLMLATTAEIVAATDLPVTADLDGGFGDAPLTVRRAIQIGVSGANVEDQMRPFDESVKLMESVMSAAESEGVPFALNARTDAVVKAEDGSHDDALAEAIRRGKAYLEVGASTVFVPGVLTREDTQILVEGIGVGKLSVIGLPGALPATEYETLGVARISYGPMTQNIALNALQEIANSLNSGGVIPESTEMLNDL